MKRRIIAFVDHEIGYRLLEKLIADQTQFDIELVAVVTTKDNEEMWWPSVSPLCRESGISLHLYSEPVDEILHYSDIDWYFLLSWKYVVPAELIQQPRSGVINLHYSLLPEYRGVYPVNWAIIDGKKETGVTYHLVNEKIDAGQIICQSTIEIHLSDTARTLQLRLDDLAYELFDKMLSFILYRDIKQPIQVLARETLGSYKSHMDFTTSNELNLDCEYRAIDLLNLLRGKTFFPNSRNLYVIDPATGERIYISVHLNPADSSDLESVGYK